MPKDLLWIAGGGAIGSVLRYLVSFLLNSSDAFPKGTLVVNVLGCFAIGALSSRIEIGTPLWLFAAVGVLGGFTTFSAFGLETVQLIRAQELGMAGLYAGLSLVLGMAAVFLGRSI